MHQVLCPRHYINIITGSQLLWRVYNSYPNDLSKNAKRALRQKAESYVVIDGELYHKGQKDKLQKVSDLKYFR